MRVGIALGSNLGDRLAYLRGAVVRVLQISAVRDPLCSRIYETEPVGTGAEAGAFLNAALEVDYEGEPVELLRALRRIEQEFGRPAERAQNANRTIDLDLLYADDQTLALPELTLPHPRLHLRRFVLAPLADIRPGLRLPGRKQSIAELLGALNDPSHVEVHPALLLP